MSHGEEHAAGFLSWLNEWSPFLATLLGGLMAGVGSVWAMLNRQFVSHRKLDAILRENNECMRQAVKAEIAEHEKGENARFARLEATDQRVIDVMSEVSTNLAHLTGRFDEHFKGGRGG